MSFRTSPWAVFVRVSTLIDGFDFSKWVRESFRLVTTKSGVQQQTPWKPNVSNATPKIHIATRTHSGYYGVYCFWMWGIARGKLWVLLCLPRSAISVYPLLECYAAGTPSEAVPTPDCAVVTLPPIAPDCHLPSSRSLSRCVKMPQRFGKLVMSFFSFNNCIK